MRPSVIFGGNGSIGAIYIFLRTNMKLGGGRASKNKAREKENISDLRVTGKREKNRYPHRLQWYNEPPIDNISLEEFEEFAIERLKGL